LVRDIISRRESQRDFNIGDPEKRALTPFMRSPLAAHGAVSMPTPSNRDVSILERIEGHGWLHTNVGDVKMIRSHYPYPSRKEVDSLLFPFGNFEQVDYKFKLQRDLMLPPKDMGYAKVELFPVKAIRANRRMRYRLLEFGFDLEDPIAYLARFFPFEHMRELEGRGAGSQILKRVEQDMQSIHTAGMALSALERVGPFYIRNNFDLISDEPLESDLYLFAKKFGKDYRAPIPIQILSSSSFERKSA
jgi:hypothetical protein